MPEAAAEGRPAPPAAGARRRYAGLPQAAVEGITALFGVVAVEEPYAPQPGEPAYALTHRGPSGTVRLVCWPSLARADVTCGPHAWVAKGIAETEIIDGVEVIFRLAGGGMLFVATNGRVMMVSAGPGRDQSGDER